MICTKHGPLSNHATLQEPSGRKTPASEYSSDDSRASNSGKLPCRKCHQMVSVRSRFCRHCGATQPAAVCPVALEPIKSDDEMDGGVGGQDGGDTAPPKAITNEGVERDHLPEKGLNEALGEAFNSRGKPAGPEGRTTKATGGIKLRLSQELSSTRLR